MAATISVLIPSRGRVRQLAAAITTLFQCWSGENPLQICVACDDDDPHTREFLDAARTEGLPVSYRVGPRPDTLGSVANDLARQWPADAYAVFADDLLCLTPGWDKVIARAVEEKPYGVFWWKSARDENTLVPIVTERWRAAAGGIFTEYFPFWYDDLWLYELWVMATDENPIVLDMLVLDRPNDTQRMRELEFWNGFYHRMREERVLHGRRIAGALGLAIPLIADKWKEMLNRYKFSDMGELSRIEQSNRAEKGEPSEQYMRTKFKAAITMQRAA